MICPAGVDGASAPYPTLVGSIINKFIRASLIPIRQRWGAKVSQTLGTVILCVVTLIFLIMITGAIFTSLETWNYRENVYFTVVSLTTVGFGDYIPAQAGSQSHRVTIQFYRFMNTVWLLMGLSLVSAILAEFQSIYRAVGNFFRIHNCCKLVKKKMVERQRARKFGLITERDIF